MQAKSRLIAETSEEVWTLFFARKLQTGSDKNLSDEIHLACGVLVRVHVRADMNETLLGTEYSFKCDGDAAAPAIKGRRQYNV